MSSDKATNFPCMYIVADGDMYGCMHAYMHTSREARAAHSLVKDVSRLRDCAVSEP